jgi:NTE family protein
METPKSHAHYLDALLTRHRTDVYMNPPLRRVGMLQWEHFDQIVAQGYAHAREVLDGVGCEAPGAASAGADAR